VTATDHAGLVVLSFAECLELINDATVGRVAFVSGGEVEVLPVNYLVDGSAVAFRTAGGSKLGAAVEHAPVTFEVDDYDDREATGWSVLIKGQAEVVSDAEVLRRLERSGLAPYVTSVPHPEWVLIHPNTVTGRRIPTDD
jgi:nitroimidazol reductase NimA-like FMN-containing flavoprotein (pyridoxamine 5'-phosphate oxidase superfamily)